MKITTSFKLAAALAAASFYSQVQACKLHITNLSGGFYAPHPLTIPVSVSTRQAIDEQVLTDIPRQSYESKIAALEKIEERLDEILAQANLSSEYASVSFSLFLTESNHWVNFVEDNGRMEIRIHQTELQQLPVVLVISDTALKNILDNRLQMQAAMRLGVLQISRSGEEAIAALESLNRIIQNPS